MWGELYDVDNLSVRELELYMDCLIRFEGVKYWVSQVERLVYEKREPRVYRGKKEIK